MSLAPFLVGIWKRQRWNYFSHCRSLLFFPYDCIFPRTILYQLEQNNNDIDKAKLEKNPKLDNRGFSSYHPRSVSGKDEGMVFPKSYVVIFSILGRYIIGSCYCTTTSYGSWSTVRKAELGNPWQRKELHNCYYIARRNNNNPNGDTCMQRNNIAMSSTVSAVIVAEELPHTYESVRF